MGVKLGVLENRVLRRILRSKKNECVGRVDKLHNDELRDLYCNDQVEEDEMGGACST
jgi:hypothetical protein